VVVRQVFGFPAAKAARGSRVVRAVLFFFFRKYFLCFSGRLGMAGGGALGMAGGRFGNGWGCRTTALLGRLVGGEVFTDSNRVGSVAQSFWSAGRNIFLFFKRA